MQIYESIISHPFYATVVQMEKAIWTIKDFDFIEKSVVTIGPNRNQVAFETRMRTFQVNFTVRRCFSSVHVTFGVYVIRISSRNCLTNPNFKVSEIGCRRFLECRTWECKLKYFQKLKKKKKLTAELKSRTALTTMTSGRVMVMQWY